MSSTEQILVVRISRISVIDGLRRRDHHRRLKDVVVRWAERKPFADNRLSYTMRRQYFVNHLIDEDGVHIVNYWGPMTLNRVKKAVQSISTNPTAGIARR